MIDIESMVDATVQEGYNRQNAEAKVCQDIVLKAISEGSLKRNVTIKGGVVMRSITGDARRATQDMDLDFIRYSLRSTSCHGMKSLCSRIFRSVFRITSGPPGRSLSPIPTLPRESR